MQRQDNFTVQQVSFSASKKTLIDQVSFEIQLPKKVALVGLNGAGKSTFIRLLTGELCPDKGSIKYSGLKTSSFQFKTNMGYQAAEMHSFANITGKEYLDFCGRLKKLSNKEYQACYQELQHQWFLEGIVSKVSTELSQGNWQKLALAQAFLGKPDYIFLDEPTQALDPVEQQRFIDNLNNLQSYQLCLFSSHHINETVEAADEVLMFHRGQLVAQLQLLSELDYWFACELEQQEFAELVGQSQLAELVYQGPNCALYKMSFESQVAYQEFISSKKDQAHIIDVLQNFSPEIGEKVVIRSLGYSKQALLPLFTLLANEVL